MRTPPARLRSPRHGLAALLAVLAALVVSIALPAAASGTFSPVTRLRNAASPTFGLSPVHATLLPDGTVLLIGVQRQDGSLIAFVAGPKFVARYTVPPLGAPPPASAALTPESVPYDCGTNCVIPVVGASWHIEDTLMCSGHTLLEDGSVFFVSGTRFLNFVPTGATAPAFSYAFGLDHNFHYNPATATWTRLGGRMIAPGEANMHGRWYGTATRMADGSVLITGGYDVVGAFVNEEVILGTQAYNVSVEAVDPRYPAGPRKLVSAAQDTPANIFNVDYSHVFLLPFSLDLGRDVLMLGQKGEAIFMAPSTYPHWLATGAIRPGDSGGWDPMHESATIMLPLRLTANEWGYNLGAIMTLGGGGASRDSRADIYDVIGGGWKAQRIDIGAPRHHPNAVILPDGRIFVIGGHDMMAGMSHHPRHGVLLTPSAGGYSVTTTPPMSTSRGYHTTALLLPDGRVMVAGGRTAGATDPSDEQDTVEFYEPDYIAGPRPSITSVPQDIHYGIPFSVRFSGTGAPSELVLIGLGSMTHSFDANQRSVELYHVQTSADEVLGVMVGDSHFAPQGHYMLFLLDENRRPSRGTIVRLSYL